MLTAVLLQTGQGLCLAPGRFLGDLQAAGLIRQAADFTAGRQPVWLTDLTAQAFWPAGDCFNSVDSRLLPWIDSTAETWLLGAADSLRLLLPQINRLLLLKTRVPGRARLQEGLPGLADPAALGFRPDEALNRRIPAAAYGSVEFWTRQSAVQILAGIMAAGDCDLHLHTSCSDGADSPAQLVDRVLANGLRAFAITDHDNLAGLGLAAERLRSLPAAGSAAVPAFIPGVELSIDDQQELHLLGYFPYGGTAAIETFLVGQRELRRQRNRKMIRQLQALGYPVSQEEFEASGDGAIGRLQAAVLLCRQGYFPSIDAAFDQLLASGRPAYVDRPRPSPAEAIWLIRQAGGAAVLAHPALYGWCGGRPIATAELLRQLAKLQRAGLQGVEAFHGAASPAVRQEISAAALALGLLRTGGSDDHGSNKENARLYQRGTHWLSKPEILVAAALISGSPQDGQATWLLTRRSSPGTGCGFWELPGGKVEAGETPADALARELAEELDVRADIGEQVLVLTHDYPERRVILVCLQAFLPEGTWNLSVHDAAQYATAGDALLMNLLPADFQIFQHLRDQGSQGLINPGS